MPAASDHGGPATAQGRRNAPAWWSDGEEMRGILLFPDGTGRVYELNEYEGFRVPNAVNIPLADGGVLTLARTGTFPGGIPVYGGSETMQ